MEIIILIVAFVIVLVSINKFSSREQEHRTEEIEWIKNLDELVQQDFVYDCMFDIELKVLTRLDSHGHIIGVDLLTMNNNVYEYLSPIKMFDSERFIRVIKE